MRSASFNEFQKSVNFEISCVEKILIALNDELKGAKYFGGEEVSIVDILYYTEISTINIFLGRSVVPRRSPIETWF